MGEGATELVIYYATIFYAIYTARILAMYIHAYLREPLVWGVTFKFLLGNSQVSRTS